MIGPSALSSIDEPETKAPAGYKINANWNASFTISGEAEDDGKVIEKDIDGKALLFTETVIRGDVRIEKWDKNLMRKAAQGDADFSGIQFEIKNASKESVVVENKTFEVGAVVKTLTTDAAGDAETTGKTLPYGTYTIREIKTNNKYLLTDGTARIFVIREDGEIVTTSTDQNSLHFDNIPVKGGISVQKDDKERASGENDSEKLVKVSGRELDPGLVVAIIATSTKGKAETEKDLLPYGTYHIYELRQDAAIKIGDPYEGSDKLGSSIYANKSYLFAANEFEVKVTENNKIYLVNFQNEAVRGGVKVGKIDRETDQNVPQGLATLKDAEFTIYNSSKESVMVGGVEYKTGEAIRSFASDENGAFETAADLLPYGTYTVKETKAPIGYLLNEEWQVTFQIREEGVIVDTMTEEGKTEDPDTSGWLEVKAGSGNNPAEVPDDIIRGDITFKKVDIDGYPMAGIPFVIQRLDADGKVVESHVIVSDEDGLVSTKSRKKTDDKVNSLDQYVKDGVFADDSKLDGSAGVWFGEQSARDDSRGALIYADYQIKELRCKANEGQDLLQTDEPIEIRENNVDVQLSNTLVDLNIRLESVAMDVTSDSKVVTYGTDVKLSDTVSYIHLKVYNEYELVTTFYNIRKDGEAVKLGEGSITFTPEKADNTKTAYGEITNIVTIDTTKAEVARQALAAGAGTDEFVYADAEKGFWFYLTPSLSIDLRRYEDKSNKNAPLVWFEADIHCSPESPMTAYLTPGTKNQGKAYSSPVELARKNRAVLAFADDNFGDRWNGGSRTGVIVRNGQIIGEKTVADGKGKFPNLEILALFSDGSMKTFASDACTAQEYIDMGAVNTYAFGPILIQNGELSKYMRMEEYYTYREPRCAIGMIAPYHYYLLVVKGRSADSKGAYLTWLADNMLSHGVVEGMNLDGGGTTALVFMGKILNWSSVKELRQTTSITGFGVSELVPEK